MNFRRISAGHYAAEDNGIRFEIKGRRGSWQLFREGTSAGLLTAGTVSLTGAEVMVDSWSREIVAAHEEALAEETTRQLGTVHRGSVLAGVACQGPDRDVNASTPRLAEVDCPKCLRAIDQAHEGALVEDVQRWIAGGPVCVCHGRGGERGHHPACPRRAYIIRMDAKTGWSADRAREADAERLAALDQAHEAALVEDSERGDAARPQRRQFCAKCIRTTTNYVTWHPEPGESSRRFHYCQSCIAQAHEAALVEDRRVDAFLAGRRAGALSPGALAVVVEIAHEEALAEDAVRAGYDQLGEWVVSVTEELERGAGTIRKAEKAVRDQAHEAALVEDAVRSEATRELPSAAEVAAERFDLRDVAISIFTFEPGDSIDDVLREIAVTGDVPIEHVRATYRRVLAGD